MKLPDLPIAEALPALLDRLDSQGQAVLQAPPGAGKTTVVPLALLQRGYGGRILILEPRRLATRAAAERMAATLGERAGQTVGYRVRGDVKSGPDTRIEVVTEGILTRMIQSDPGLAGIGTVIFDEFHERSLNADLGLALVAEVRGALRPDLRLIVMSATLDAAPVAEMLDAPVVTAEGRMFPVRTQWLDRPLPAGTRTEAAAADLIAAAAARTSGGLLAFLPGEGEIRRTATLLRGRLPADCRIMTLYGAMPLADQRAVLAPLKEGRKVVLATSIAETSLTIPDITVVVDAGLARRARFDPASGMSRLVTERASRAEAEQRRGRAGRVAEGVCYRMWARAEEGAMPAFAPAEIETADLAPLAMELALWGAGDGAGLALLTPPNSGALASARQLLSGLGALDDKGRITDHGRRLAELPLHPRLGHMLLRAGRGAAPLAALLAEGGPGPMDLSLRLRQTAANPGRDGAGARVAAEARRLARLAPPDRGLSVGAMAALAYPDRIGLRRKGQAARWILSGGKGAWMDDDQPLAGERLIVATDLDGDKREARVRQAAALTETELRDIHADRIAWIARCEWSRREGRIVARREECLGALVLSAQHWPDPPPEAVAGAALEHIRQSGLPWTPAARAFQARVIAAREALPDLPDMGDAALMTTAENWLLPHLGQVRSQADIAALDLASLLRGQLGWEQQKALDRLAPPHFQTPTGRRIAIDYTGGAPEVSVRLQEMFGTRSHPQVAGRPLRITLLSPAGRPLQTTVDLPGFWANAYADVRKEMRGRYPKHPWPEDPATATPTTRAKPRRA